MTTLRRDIQHKIENYILTLEDVSNSGWYFLGDSESQYLKISLEDWSRLPPHTDYCLCKHRIKHQCYITNGKDIKVLGNCCVKRWLPEHLRKRTCKECRSPHNNRKDNYCNDCRKKLQIKIKKECGMCKAFHRNRKDNFCNTCREKIKIQENKEEEEQKTRKYAYWYTLYFGKYKYQTLEYVYNTNPQYLTWLLENLNGCDLRNQRLFDYINIILKDNKEKVEKGLKTLELESADSSPLAFSKEGM